jgi:hypothetical protein
MARSTALVRRSRSNPASMAVATKVALAIGAGVGAYAIYKSVKAKKDKSYCDDLWFWQRWSDPRCQNLSGAEDNYSGGYGYSPYYHCVWVGAKDSNSNDSVTALVNALHDKGYAPAGQPRIPTGIMAPKIDVMFDYKIRDAVIRFQQANNLKADGVVGKQTWTALGIGGWTGMNLADCPRCAGQFEFGQSPPADCTSARPPTPAELAERAIKAKELTGKDFAPGSSTPMDPEDVTPTIKKPPAPTPWGLYIGIGVATLGLIGGGVYYVKRKKK